MTRRQPSCNGCIRYNKNGDNLGNCIEKKPIIYLNEDRTVYRYCPCMECIVKTMCTELCTDFFKYSTFPKEISIIQS